MGQYWPEDWVTVDSPPSVPTVWDDDPNPVIGTLLIPRVRYLRSYGQSPIEDWATDLHGEVTEP